MAVGMYGKRLKEKIKEKGYLQKDIALMLNTAESNVSSWCKAEYPPLEAIEQIMKTMNTELYEFFITKEEIEKISDIPVEYISLIKQLLKMPEDFRNWILKHVYDLIDQYLKWGKQIS
jgi:transcriptional regulator with XRE-family HTH domain